VTNFSVRRIHNNTILVLFYNESLIIKILITNLDFPLKSRTYFRSIEKSESGFNERNFCLPLQLLTEQCYTVQTKLMICLFPFLNLILLEMNNI